MKEPILYKITRPLIKIFMNIVYHPTYLGLENIPKEGPFILAGNHTNNFDCLLIMSSTNKTVHFLAKDSLSKGFKRHLFNHMGIIPVNRQIHDKSALISAIRALNEQKVIGIFPEGTINRTKDSILPFKIGSVKMSHDTKSPIIPFTITGKYKPFKNDLTITFYEPIIASGDDLTSENEKLMQIISHNLEKRK